MMDALIELAWLLAIAAVAVVVLCFFVSLAMLLAGVILSVVVPIAIIVYVVSEWGRLSGSELSVALLAMIVSPAIGVALIKATLNPDNGGGDE